MMNNPQPLHHREMALFRLYVNCQLGMTPQAFYAKWGVNYEQIAEICHRSLSTVRRWFLTGQNYRSPTDMDLNHLAMMDFFWENFDQIPHQLRDKLCQRN